MSKHIAIAGVTGAVGQELLSVLAERDFPIASLRPLASARSAGKTVTFKGEPITVEELTNDSFAGIDIAFFTAGGSISKAFAAPAVEAGAVVVDNTSAFRMKDGIPLVVPEVNPEAAHKHMGLIANPNCSTIIMAVPVWPLFQAFRLKRVVVSTYQAVSGAGAVGLDELERQARQHVAGEPITNEKFAHQVIHNVFSHDSAVDPDTGRNVEEQKMIDETAKIFSTDKLGVSATCIRVPVPRTHCESINLEFAEAVTPEQVRDVLAAAPGIRIVDDRAANHFPMPTEASGQDDVLVGRIRQDSSRPDNRG
ncbi:MAG: aspartate-semialdehyde dehydrogenase, partial [Planctomycetota bacterium]